MVPSILPNKKNSNQIPRYFKSFFGRIKDTKMTFRNQLTFKTANATPNTLWTQFSVYFQQNKHPPLETKKSIFWLDYGRIRFSIFSVRLSCLLIRRIVLSILCRGLKPQKYVSNCLDWDLKKFVLQFVYIVSRIVLSILCRGLKTHKNTFQTVSIGIWKSLFCSLLNPFKYRYFKLCM